MPGPESRTATSMPPAWLCSVLINNSRSPSATELITRMRYLESFADLTGGLKTSDSGALAGARVNDHHRTLAVIYLNACRRDHR